MVSYLQMVYHSLHFTLVPLSLVPGHWRHRSLGASTRPYLHAGALVHLLNVLAPQGHRRKQLQCTSDSTDRIVCPVITIYIDRSLYPSKAGLGLTYSYETIDPGSELSGTQGFSVMGSLKSEHFKNRGKGRQLQ